VAYTLSNSLAEVLTIFVAMLLRWPAPLAVAQILWIHLICDGPSDIVLGFEPKEPGTMDEPPLPKNAPALTGLGLSLIGVISAVSSVSMRRPLWQMVPLKENRTLIWTVLAGIATALIAFLIPGSGLRHRMEQTPTFLFPPSPSTAGDSRSACRAIALGYRVRARLPFARDLDPDRRNLAEGTEPLVLTRRFWVNAVERAEPLRGSRNPRKDTA